MKPNGDNKAVIDCPVCKQRFSAELPTPTTINTPTFSAMVAPHEKIIRCPNNKCAQPMTFALVSASINWAACAITPEVAEQMSGSRIIQASPLGLMH